MASGREVIPGGCDQRSKEMPAAPGISSRPRAVRRYFEGPDTCALVRRSVLSDDTEQDALALRSH